VTKNLKVGLLATGVVVLAAGGALAVREALKKGDVAAAVAPTPSVQPSGGAQDSAGVAAPAPQPAVPSDSAPTAQTGSADIMQAAHTAFFSCHAPFDLPAPPDGATASKEEMVAAHRAASAYNDNMNHYLDCLQSKSDSLESQYRGTASAQDLAQIESLHTGMHNAAIDRLQSNVQRFNKELVKFKASRSPPG
jgi:hypothetical protein